MEQLIRRKRVNELGEWEYECSVCKLWLEKRRFRGCMTYVDAYGNCLLCSSCRGKKGMETKYNNEKQILNELMIIIGYDPHSDIPVWKQFHDRHNLPYPK